MKILCLAALGAAMLSVSAIARAGDGADSNGSFKQPAVIGKMTDGTRRLVNGTKSMLLPKKQQPVRKSGTTAIHKKNAEPPKQGFFHSWFHSEPPQTPRTMREWMALKQVQPSTAR